MAESMAEDVCITKDFTDEILTHMPENPRPKKADIQILAQSFPLSCHCFRRWHETARHSAGEVRWPPQRPQ